MRETESVNNESKHQEITELLNFIDTLERFANWRVQKSTTYGRVKIMSDSIQLGEMTPTILGNGQLLQDVATDLQKTCVKILDPLALRCRQRIEELSKTGKLGIPTKKDPA